MLADLLGPVWDFLFETFGVFGIMLACLSPILMIGLVVLVFYWLFRLVGVGINLYKKSYLNKANQAEREGDYKTAWDNLSRYRSMRKEADPELDYHLATLCLKGEQAGWDCSDNHADSLLWFKRAAKAGVLPAQFYIEKCRFDENEYVDMLECAKAYTALKKMADGGYTEAQAFIEQVENKRKEASYHSKNGRTANAQYGDRLMQHEMGLIEKSNRDERKALEWFLLAAESGLKESQFFCGVLYLKGANSVPKDEGKAVYWLDQAAKQHHIEAIHWIGRYYAAMKKVPDYEKAIEYLTIAAERRSGEAAYLIAYCYSKMADDYAKRNNIKTKLDGISHTKYMGYFMEMQKWLKLSEEYGYKPEK